MVRAITMDKVPDRFYSPIRRGGEGTGPARTNQESLDHPVVFRSGIEGWRVNWQVDWQVNWGATDRQRPITFPTFD